MQYEHGTPAQGRLLLPARECRLGSVLAGRSLVDE